VRGERYILGPSMINGKVVSGTIIKSAFAQLQTNGTWVVVFNLNRFGFDAVQRDRREELRAARGERLDGR